MNSSRIRSRLFNIYSNTDEIQANLHYLDDMPLKEQDSNANTSPILHSQFRLRT